MIKEPRASFSPDIPEPELTPGVPNPNLLILDQNLPVPEQLDQFAANQARPNLQGLTYIRGDRLIVVNSLDEIELDVDKRNDPNAHIEVGPRFYVKNRVIHTGDRQRVPIKETKREHRYSLDEYSLDGERLLNIRQASAQGLKDDIANLGVDGNVLWFQEQEPQVNKDRLLPVVVPEKGSVYASANQARVEHDLDDMSGLTWQHQGKKWNIKRQVTIYERRPGMQTDLTPILKFEVVSSDGAGGVTKKIVKATDLKKRLDSLKPTERNELNMHFEVSKEPQKLRISRMVGQLITERRIREPDNLIRLSTEEATNMLQFPELNPDNIEAIRLQNKIKNDPDFDDIVESLKIINLELESERFNELVRRMHANLLFDLELLGLPLRPEDRSTTPIVWELAKQRFSADNPSRVAELDKGLEIGNPIGYTKDHRLKQYELLERLLGQAIAEHIRPVNTVPTKELVDMGDGSFAEMPHVKQNVDSPSDRLLLQLPGKIGLDVRSKLHHLNSENPRLTYKSQVELGRMAHEAIGR